jgi:dipeptidyl aminopeptidase/acylaminoacyl peptidase
VLVFQGTSDTLVPYSQAIKLANAMSAAGVPGRVELLLGAGHAFGGEEYERAMKETVEFFDRQLKPKAAAARP